VDVFGDADTLRTEARGCGAGMVFKVALFAPFLVFLFSLDVPPMEGLELDHRLILVLLEMLWGPELKATLVWLSCERCALSSTIVTCEIGVW
jgi:hypothetical protein